VENHSRNSIANLTVRKRFMGSYLVYREANFFSMWEHLSSSVVAAPRSFVLPVEIEKDAD